MLAINTESNPSKSYRQHLVLRLCELGKFVNNKEFKQITREDHSIMDKFRKPEAVDQLHKWVGTYNFFLVCLLNFSDGCALVIRAQYALLSGYLDICIFILRI